MLRSRNCPSLVVTAVILWACGIYGGQPLGGLRGGCTARAGDAADVSAAARPVVIINELHVNPDIKTDQVEFVELYNPGTSDVDLAGT